MKSWARKLLSFQFHQQWPQNERSHNAAKRRQGKTLNAKASMIN